LLRKNLTIDFVKNVQKNKNITDCITEYPMSKLRFFWIQFRWILEIECWILSVQTLKFLYIELGGEGRYSFRTVAEVQRHPDVQKRIGINSGT